MKVLSDHQVKQEKKHEQNKLDNQWILDNCNFVFFDTESGNLNAPFSRIIGACVLDRDTHMVDQYVASKTDKRLVRQLRDRLEEADYVVTYYGTGHDIPYLNTRLLLAGERPLRAIRHIDLYYTARYNLKLHSNRLAAVCDTLFGGSKKTKLIPAVWERAMQGNRESIKYVMEHCVADVEELERVFDALVGFRALSETPLKGGYFG